MKSTLNNSPYFCTKKGASLYNKHWKLLKDNPGKLVTFNLLPYQQERFIRMVQKRKWLDTKFKAAYPKAKIKVYRYETHIKLLLTLTNQLYSL